MRVPSFNTYALNIPPVLGSAQSNKVSSVGCKQSIVSPQKKLDASVNNYITENNIPGALVRVTKRNGAVLNSSAGVSNINSRKALKPDQTYEIGSQTKTMTAVVVLKLVEQNKIKLDEPVSKYLDPKTLKGIANADKVTIRQLLSMRSGIPNYTEITDADGIPLQIKEIRANPDKIFGPDEALSLVRGKSASFKPGEKFEYSNTNYTLLGKLIEKVTKQPLQNAYKKMIFEPLNMSDTQYPKFPVDKKRMSGYSIDPSDPSGKLIDVTNANVNYYAEGGVVSSARDMTKFFDGLLKSKTLLSPKLLKEMTNETNEAKEFIPPGSSYKAYFGLGLLTLKSKDLGTVYGFNGETLAGDSSTYYSTTTGNIVTTADNLAGNDSQSFALEALNSL